MPIYPGVSDSQKKVPPLPPSVASRSDSGSGRAFDNGATFLTFNPTVFDGKLPIIDYLITATSETNETVTNTVANLNSFVFTGLRSGVRYRYKIRARNSVSESVDSAEVGPDIATTVPGRPTSLTAINLSNGGGISLSWVAPSNAGKAITSYTITPSVGAPIVTNSASTTYSFSGVVGTVYNFTVAATNENGTGIDSTASGTVTPTPAPTPPPTPVVTPPPPGIGITSFTAGAGFSELANALVVVGNWSAFGYASWSLSGIGQTTGIVNGTESSGSPRSGANPSQFCGQTATATLVVYSGPNGTGTSATSNVNFTMPSSGSGCPTGGGPITSNTYWYTVCCLTGSTYSQISRSSDQGASTAAYFAEQACTNGGGRVQGGQQSYSVNAPVLQNCSAPVALPCSTANGNCGTPTCAACDSALSGPVQDPDCPSGYRNRCWTGGSCPNTGDCVPVTVVTPTPTPIVVTTTYCPSLGTVVPLSGYPGNCPGAQQSCSGPCLGTWSIVGGVCRCTATPTPTPTPVATVCVPTGSINVGNCTIYFDSCGGADTVCATATPVPPTPVPPTPTPSGCPCRDFRGRCVSVRFCEGI
jgi:hypothetical protein